MPFAVFLFWVIVVFILHLIEKYDTKKKCDKLKNSSFAKYVEEYCSTPYEE